MNTARRDFLVALGACAGSLAITSHAESGRPSSGRMHDAIRGVVGDALVQPGRVKLEVPPLIDNGNAVPLSIAVESPMTPSDHVKAIHVFAEKNPQPYVFSAFLGPRSGQARISTRVRLADTQTLTAIVQLSDGSFWSDSVSVIVTLAACLEELT